MKRGKGSPIVVVLEEHGVTPETLAEESGVSLRTIRRWIVSGTRLQKRCCERIAEYLRMDPLAVSQLSWKQRAFVDQIKTDTGLFAAYCFFLRMQRLSASELEAAELDSEMLAFVRDESANLCQRVADIRRRATGRKRKTA
ncbi:MAG TPA: helix-turn-helix transcriptional regulator [Pirellulaceae bacterium]|nr:helix-turn-helix transcriptional regulator [Pirellulaceae bacterium]